MTSYDKFRILLIEDDEDDAFLFSILIHDFKSIQCETEHHTNLQDGLKSIDTFHPNIIFCDLNLPDSVGRKTIISILDKAQQIAVIILTGLNDNEMGIEALNLGAQDFLVKGRFDANQLLNSMKYAVSRKEIEERLKTNTNLLFNIFNEAPYMLFLVDQERRVVRINNAALKFTMSTEKKLLGEKAGETFNCLNSFNQIGGCGAGKACEKCVIKATVEETFRTGKSIKDVETQITFKNQNKTLKIDVLLSTSIIETDTDDLVQITLNDISELKKSQHLIEKNNNRLESLVNISQHQSTDPKEFLDFSLNQAIELTDSKIGYLYYYNEQRKQFILNSWSNEVMKECEVVEPQTTYDLDSTGCWGEAVRQGKPIVINNYNSNHEFAKGVPEGHVVLNNFLTIPVFENNKIVAVVGVGNKQDDYDQTDVYQLQVMMDTVWKILARQKNEQELIIAKERAEESDRLKSAFLATMSHELRTPLNSVIGFSDILLEEPNTPSLMEFLKAINKSGKHLHSIIEEIFTISELEGADVKLKEEEFTIQKLLDNIEFEETRNMIRKGKIKLKLRNTTENKFKSTSINTDYSRLKLVFANLIGNALKFTSKGKIEFGMKLVNNTPAFFVSDTGIGISSKDQKNIFDRFIQVEQTITREYEGVGLGLTICKKIIELLNGKIWVESELGKGTSIFFTFPELIVKVFRPEN